MKPNLQKSPVNETPLYQVMKTDLSRAIAMGELAPGSRVASESELIARYKVSNTTARRCLDELEQQGYLKRIRGKGTFVSDLAMLLQQRQVAVLIRDFETLSHPLVSRVLSTVEQTVEGANIHLSIQRIPPPADPLAAGRTLLSSLRYDRSEFALLLSSVPLSVIQPLVDDGIKCLGVNTRYQDPRIPHMAIDFEALLVKAFSTFAEYGHRRLVVLASEPPMAVQGASNSSSWIQSAWQSTREKFPDLPMEVRICLVPGPSLENLPRAVEELMGGSSAPTAFFCWDEHAGLETVRCLRDLGFQVPAQVSVAGPKFLPSSELACIEMPFAAMAAASAQALLDWAEGRVPESKLFAPGEFLARETLIRPPV
jgi:DNA-binding LacI/PurR family transcriptional regulator